MKSSLDLSEDEWNSTMKTNATGTWLVSKYVCLRMRAAKKGGSIINISSIAGLNRGHLPGSVAYTCSKSAVNELTKVRCHKISVLYATFALDLARWLW